MIPITRREMLRAAALSAAALALPACADGAETSDAAPAGAARPADAPLDSLTARQTERLQGWVRAVRQRRLAEPGVPLGRTAAAVGEEARGTPYLPATLEAYIVAGGNPTATEPLTISLDHFDCVTLVESCLAIGRLARAGAAPAWADFAREMERVRYRGGKRAAYTSRLHYFSEWIDDNAARGLVRPLGRELGGEPDDRPLRFMSTHREAYPALASDPVYAEIQRIERTLDSRPRYVVPTEKIASVADRIETGDVLAFATSIEGLDVTHSAMAFRDDAGILRVLHAPLSGGVVEITRSTLPEYVRAIRRATGILVARPL